MRFAVKSTLALLISYLLFLGGIAWWVDGELRDLASSLMADTARLVGNEIGAAMSGSARDELLEADPVTNLRLSEMVADLTGQSDTVASIAVVDQEGRVVVSDEIEPGRQVASPGVIFQNERSTLFLPPTSPFQSGAYHLIIPLLRADDVVGYIRLSLSNHGIVRLYRRARRELLLAAAVGLTGIGVLGVLLHVRLSRRSAAVARAIEATARGEGLPPAPRRDEFAEVMAAAGRLGRALSESRERSSQAQRRLNALATFMDSGVLLLRGDRTIEYANATACDLLECPGLMECEGVWETVRPQLDAALDGAVGAGTAARIDIDLPVDGATRRMRFDVHRAGDEAHEGYLVLVKDRDLIEAFETDLRLATQMRGLAGAYGALAHEIRAPLGAMALNLELLDDTVRRDTGDDADTRARQRRYTSVLRQELERLNRSLVAVLSQTTALRDARETLDVVGLIRDVATLLGPQAAHQRVEFDARLPAGPVWLSGHRDRLKQAFLNLATNALEAMPAGGRLSVEVEPQNGRVSVALRDTGPGIPADLLGKIFNMYYTTKDGGTGIGLHVARSVVEAHGGEIEVDTRPGAGTCFRVSLPVDRPTG
jgi:signal transduction histidine kinase